MTAQIVVVQAGKKFKVLVNGIQRGIEYSTKELALEQAKIAAGAPC